MKLKSLMDSPCGLRWCIDELPLASSLARRRLLDRDLYTYPQPIRAAYQAVLLYREALDRVVKNWPDRMHAKLCNLKDLSGSLERIAGGLVLEDTELFEIKLLEILAREVAALHQEAGLEFDLPCELEQVQRWLDPDQTGVATFYIYDSYSPVLADLRKQIRNLPLGEERSELVGASMLEEARVRERLTRLLAPAVEPLRETLQMLADADLNLAKALLMVRCNRVIPQESAGEQVHLEDFRHPQIEALLSQQGKAYQPVSLSYGDTPLLIIGSNMGGKTVVLKSLALCQYLYQAAIPLPVKSASMRIFESVYLCHGDGQDLEAGLSSFSSEMLRIHAALQAVRQGERALVLIDEPARSTNPIEGTALVDALLRVMGRLCPSLVMTTHYDLRSESFRRLKVRGLENGTMNYALVDAPYDEVPHEALAVAAHLQLDAEWIQTAQNILNNNR
ncbi:MAG: hypothetical protein J6U70_04705 [Bacteroidales bacterium]|nr:hypothetical protein [Bacteroidales bacterium]